MKYVSNSIEETTKISKDFVDSLFPKETALVVGLYGDLGAGKTSFVQSVAKILGISDQVTSPTFVIEKIYELENQKFIHLIHIDAYRLESGSELLKLGWSEIIGDKNNLIFVEWPERVQNIMPEHIKINFKTLPGGSSREIEIEV